MIDSGVMFVLLVVCQLDRAAAGRSRARATAPGVLVAAPALNRAGRAG